MMLISLHGIKHLIYLSQKWIYWFVLLTLLSACQPDATPIAAVLPITPTPAIEETLPPPIRYAIGNMAQGNIATQDLIAENALIIPLADTSDTSGLGADYDILAEYGLHEGWQQSPVLPTVSLIINPKLAPLDKDTVANIIRNSLDSGKIALETGIIGTIPLSSLALDSAPLRAELANMGYPDGFDLHIGNAFIPHAEAITSQFLSVNIDSLITQYSNEDILTAINRNRLHLALVKWHNVAEKSAWTALVGENNFIDLYQLPISYLAMPDLKITFSEDGFPIASY